MFGLLAFSDLFYSTLLAIYAISFNFSFKIINLFKWLAYYKIGRKKVSSILLGGSICMPVEMFCMTLCLPHNV